MNDLRNIFEKISKNENTTFNLEKRKEEEWYNFHISIIIFLTKEIENLALSNEFELKDIRNTNDNLQFILKNKSFSRKIHIIPLKPKNILDYKYLKYKVIILTQKGVLSYVMRLRKTYDNNELKHFAFKILDSISKELEWEVTTNYLIKIINWFRYKSYNSSDWVSMVELDKVQ